MPSICSELSTLRIASTAALIGRVLVAPAHPARGHDRGRFGNPGKFQSEVAIDRAALSWCLSIIAGIV